MTTPTSRRDLTDREMLLLLNEQMRQVQASLERLATSIEQRLAAGDRRFAELERAQVDAAARHTAVNSALNSLNGMVVDLERQLDRQASRILEWETWKTRAQAALWVVGALWAAVQFALPYLQQLIARGIP